MPGTKTREKQIDAWYRELNDGRVEIMCRAPGHRIRVAAPADEAWAAVELFEQWTGLSVEFEKRPRRRPRQLEGQLAMSELLTQELESEDNGGPDELP